MLSVGFSLLIYDKFIAVDWKDKSVRGTHTLTTIGIKGIELREEMAISRNKENCPVINVWCPCSGVRVT